MEVTSSDGSIVHYGIESIVWPERPKGADPNDESIATTLSDPEEALIRREGDRSAVIGDPRYEWQDDDGVVYAPVGQFMYGAKAAGAPKPLWGNWRLPRATDEELLAFAEEAEEMVSAFVELLSAERRNYVAATRRMSDLRGRQR